MCNWRDASTAPKLCRIRSCGLYPGRSRRRGLQKRTQLTITTRQMRGRLNIANRVLAALTGDLILRRHAWRSYPAPSVMTSLLDASERGHAPRRSTSRVVVIAPSACGGCCCIGPYSNVIVRLIAYRLTAPADEIVTPYVTCSCCRDPFGYARTGEGTADFTTPPPPPHPHESPPQDHTHRSDDIS